MWFKKIIQEQNENIQKVLNILDNCNHLVKIDTLYKKNSDFEYRYFDMIAGYYWLVSNKKNEIQIKTGDVLLVPKNDEELIKMLDIEINKSMIFEIQKQTLLHKK